jgi:hypothetical protein
VSDAPRRPATSSAFDRVAAPRSHDRGPSGSGRRSTPRDGLGKEALYSTSPTSAPTSQVEARCRRCDVPVGLSILGVAKLLARPFLWDPFRGRLWTRCPACRRRAWLEVHTGQALRVLLDRAT